jgi:hypothetical protein
VVVWYRVGYFLGERMAVRSSRLPGRQLRLGRFGGSRCRVGRFDFDGKVDGKVWVAPVQV